MLRHPIAPVGVVMCFVALNCAAACASPSSEDASGQDSGPTETRDVSAGTDSASLSSDGGDDQTNTASEAGDEDAMASDDTTGDELPNDDASLGDAGASPCGPSNCNGCCDLLGTCQVGNDSANCGNGGLACVNCGPESCQAGGCAGVATDAGTVDPKCVGVGCNGTDDCVTWDPILLGLNCGFTDCVYGPGATGSGFNLGVCR
jgi:hypothetical protein